MSLELTAQSSRSKLPDGLLIAAVPVLGSLLAYLFEFGYVSFYKIPASLIQLDVTRILSGSVAVLVAATAFVMLVAQFADLMRGRHPLTRAIGRALLFVSIWIPLVVLLPTVDHWWKPLGLMAGFFLVVELVAPLFNRKSSAKYWERVDESSMFAPRPPAAPATVSQAVGKYILGPIAGSLMLCGVVVLLGDAYARVQTRHWVLSDKPDMLLVSTYGDLAVFKRFDPQTRQIGNEMLVRKFGDSNPLGLHLTSTGELRATTPAAPGG